METITSKENQTIKTCRLVSSQGKARRELGLFMAEGLRLCREAVRCGLTVECLLLTPDARARYGPALEDVEKAAGRVLDISEDLGKHVAETKTPQGVFALCRTPAEEVLAIDPEGKYLILENIQDAGNLGAMLRTADAFGMDGVILSADCPDCYAPRVLRGAMGSVFRVKTHYVLDLGEQVDAMRARGMSIFAATLDGGSVPVWELPPKGVGVVIGNEGGGVTDELLRRCGQAVHIPMVGETESLNAAVAAAIVMWELRRQGG